MPRDRRAVIVTGPSPPYLRALSARLATTWPMRCASASTGGRSDGTATWTAGIPGHSPRSPVNDAEQRREVDPRPVEAHRGMLELGQVEELVDEQVEACRRVADPLHRPALGGGVELEVEQRST